MYEGYFVNYDKQFFFGQMRFTEEICILNMQYILPINFSQIDFIFN